jgi:hypothetical protein
MRAFELFEKRRNAHINKKIDSLEELKQYANDPTMFVSFVDSMDQGMVRNKSPHTKGTKIGINPTYSYGTPLGIYVYPVDYVLMAQGNVPFAKDRAYMYVVQATGNMIDFSLYTERQMDEDVRKLHDIIVKNENYEFRFKHIVEKAKNSATNKSAGGMIWNITRELASDTDDFQMAHATPIQMYVNKYWYPLNFNQVKSLEDLDDKIATYNAVHKTTMDSPIWKELLSFGKENVVDAIRAQRREYGIKLTTRWSKLFMQLGYDGCVDVEGEGIIHTNEPVQALFFSKKGLREVDVIRNRRLVDRTPTPVDMYIDNPLALKKFLTKRYQQGGKFTPEELKLVRDVLEGSHVSIFTTLGWGILPVSIQDEIKEKYFAWAYPYNLIPFTDEEYLQQLKDNADDTVYQLGKRDFHMTQELMAKILAADFLEPGQRAHLLSIWWNRTIDPVKYVRENPEYFKYLLYNHQSTVMTACTDPKELIGFWSQAHSHARRFFGDRSLQFLYALIIEGAKQGFSRDKFDLLIRSCLEAGNYKRADFAGLVPILDKVSAFGPTVYTKTLDDFLDY